jgi:predicted nucleic acid-binding protein
MTIIVDSNIVFSALLNTSSRIGEILLNSKNSFTFQSCYFLSVEIEKHWEKLKRISKLNEIDLRESQRLIYSSINFIDEGQIPLSIREKAYQLAGGIDLKDVVFVALAEYQKGLLWTGDKILVNGLKNNGYQNLVTTQDMVKLRFGE